MARAFMKILRFRSRRLTILARYAAILLGMIAVALALSSVAYAGLRPYMKSQQSAKTLAELERDVEQKRKERDDLRAGIDWMKSPQGAFELSRKKGMVKPGEHAVRVEVVPAEESPAPAAVMPPENSSPAVGIAILFVLAFGVGVLWLLLRRRRIPQPADVLTARADLLHRRDP